MRVGVISLTVSIALASASARAAPAHEVCADLGGSLALGVSSCSAAVGSTNAEADIVAQTGRSDPTTLPVKVVASGHPDLAGQSFFDDDGRR